MPAVFVAPALPLLSSGLFRGTFRIHPAFHPLWRDGEFPAVRLKCFSAAVSQAVLRYLSILRAVLER